jgi:hypothetical protein
MSDAPRITGLPAGRKSKLDLGGRIWAPSSLARWEDEPVRLPVTGGEDDQELVA